MFGKFISNSKNASFKDHAKVKIVNEGEVEWIAGVLPTIEGSNPAYANVNSYKEMQLAADQVNTVRLTGVLLDNNEGNIEVTGIERIECYGNVRFGISGSSTNVNGNVEISITDLTEFVIAENASLEIYNSSWSGGIEDMPENKFTWANGMVIYNNGRLAISEVHVTEDAAVQNAGSVRLNNILGTAVITEARIPDTNASWTVIN